MLTRFLVVIAWLTAVVACGRSHLWLGAGDGGVAGQGGSPSGGAGPGPGGGGGEAGAGGSGGVGGACSSDFECADADACTTDRCEMGECQHTLKDADDDGFVDVACSGDDCNDLNPNAHPGHPEVCTDAADNDCNGVADCFDPFCDDAPVCGCVPSPGGEVCDNALDDDCDTTVDCNDADCIGTPACGCAPNETGMCFDGIDNDCDGPLDCDDPECAGTTECQCATTVEQCANDADDDCDLLIDCADSDCANNPACSCIPPGSPEVCNDNFDNDCDELVDCADPSCVASPSCAQCTPEDCANGLDDDCDDKIDCADESCAFSPSCTPTAELCNNDFDDDFDGLIDCDDPDCANNPLCVEEQANCLTAKLIPGTGTFTGDTTGHVGHHMGACGGGAGEAVFFFVLNEPSFVHLDTVGTSFDSVLYVKFGSCEGGAEIACDDDSGGFQWSAALDFPILYPGTYFVFVDGFTVDPNQGANEGPFILNVQIVPDPPEMCTDGIDNDGDVHVDCADADCAGVSGCATCFNGGPGQPEFDVSACTDGLDNDCDGDTDCADDDCSASPYAVTECCDGDDDNDNGIIDDFSCRCATDADCPGGQICYTHTVHACGLPCFQFFGMVCPAVALGSHCNFSTQQCEF